MDAVADFSGGYADPVIDAQASFRALMDAMARPGRPTPLSPAIEPPAGLGRAAAAVLLALCDADTPVWFDADGAYLAGWLNFQTGAPVARSPGEAAFAVVTDLLPPLDAFAQGSQDYPDRSTTIICQIAALTNGGPLRLTGPGVDGTETIAPSGLPADFLAQWSENRGRFPRGVDIVLCSPEAIIALPRSVTIEKAGG
jgi:alpha-D-ribose 1-methylphosphonate 5-triphosphate synthase subunit PhnH